MSREFKFRAWNKRESQYSLPFTFQSLLDDIAWYDVCEVWLHYGTGNGDYWTLYRPYFDEQEWVLQQYTGLKDRGGRDIYESDILISTENGNVYLVEEFIPIQRTDNLTRLGVYIDGKYHKVPEDMVLGDDWKSWPEMYEVIGNIYENPELLKEIRKEL